MLSRVEERFRRLARLLRHVRWPVAGPHRTGRRGYVDPPSRHRQQRVSPYLLALAVLAPIGFIVNNVWALLIEISGEHRAAT